MRTKFKVRGSETTHLNSLKTILKFKLITFTLKITQLEKARFIKVNELKLTEVELLLFSHFMCVAAIASELFCMAHLANNELFLYHSNFSFLVLNFICM